MAIALFAVKTVNCWILFLCPRCGRESARSFSEGTSYITGCRYCGIICATSYFSPCQEDEGLYKIRIMAGKITNKQLIQLHRFTKIPTLELRKMGENIEFEFSLTEY